MHKSEVTGRERLKSKKDFAEIYNFGTTLFSSDKKLKAVYVSNTGSNKNYVMFAPVVSKKSGNAVWRNRVKRLIKEAYRLNKHILLEYCLNRSILLKFVVSPNVINQSNYKRIKLVDVQKSMINILEKLCVAL